MKLRNFVTVIVVLGLSFLLSLSTVVAQPVVLKFPHEAPDTSIKGRTITYFADLVKKNTNGSIIIQVFSGAQLMPGREEVRAVVRGQAHIISPQTSYYSSLDPAFDILFQPLLIKDLKQGVELMEGPFMHGMLDRLNKVGLKGLGTWHDGPGYLFIKSEPIRDIKDIRGKKIRVFPSAPLEDGVRAVSAIPIALPPGDVFLSLQQGVIDGVITTPTYAAPSKWYEVVKGMTRMMMFMGGYGIVVNKDTWDKLSTEHKDAISSAMKAAERWNHDEFFKNLEDCEKTLRANGVKIADLTPEQYAAWRAAMQPVYDKQPSAVKPLIETIKAMK